MKRIELYGCSLEMVPPDSVASIRLRLYQFGPLDPAEDIPPDAISIFRLVVEAPDEVEPVTRAPGDRQVHDRRDGSYTSAQCVAIMARPGAKGYRVVSEEPL